jgi:hypothetical protein
MTVRHSTTWPNVFSVYKLLSRTSASMMSYNFSISVVTAMNETLSTFCWYA